MNVFNRKDAQVKKDAIALSEADFIAKYKEQTTESVLKSVYSGFGKDRKVSTTTDTAVDMPTAEEKVKNKLTPVAEFTAEDKAKVKVSKTQNGSKVVEITESKNLEDRPEVKNAAKKEETGEAKAGRTPRMRELIVEGKDKAAAKAILEEEGFTCSGSGFHSEWNRVSKSAKK